jgi:transposase, IS5 family
MREILTQQQCLVPHVDHPHARELAAISVTLDELPELSRVVHKDLVRGLRKPQTGRSGLAAEQVLRILILKQLKQFSYEQLQFELASSWVYQRFCRWDPNKSVPNRRTLQRNLRRVRAETLQSIHDCIVRHAVDEGIERGRKVRTDCTVEESNIHPPSDSSLLWDGVRVLTRLMHKARELVGFNFSDHTCRAKRRAKGIMYGRSMKKRLPLYEDLLKTVGKTLSYVDPCLSALKSARGTIVDLAKALSIAAEIKHYRELVLQVIDQTIRRVIQGESVPASEKILSLFEPHTDIIVKDRRETHYGHKICLTTGASGLVLDIQVLDGNPSDSTLAVAAIQRVKCVIGALPRQASFDGGFASKQNLQELKELGVEDVAFHKKCGLEVSAMAKSTWVYNSLKRFRAGIESGISFLKRCFGLDRCTWKGSERFQAYTLASSLSHNLLIIARHRLA